MSLIKLWKARNQIKEGLINKMFKKEHVEEIYNERLSLCKTCPHFDSKGDDCYVSGTQPCCGICGCSLSLKLRSLSSACADEINPKWDAVLTTEEEDELNEQINTEDGNNV